MTVRVDTAGWSGEGDFTARLVEVIGALAEVAFLKVEDAPASRADSGFSFLSNELFITFASTSQVVRRRRFGIVPVSAVVSEKAMTLPLLESALTAVDDVGAPDYSDEGMLQYLRTQRIIPPYQSRGVKLVELVRIYEAGAKPRHGG